jgi:hypothetical protein
MPVTREKIEKKIKVDANIAPVLDYMLKKANINLSDINESFIKVWINQNLDLLNDSEKKQFNFTQK